MDYEVNLLFKMGIKVYKIPPMMSNEGYYLDSWKREDKVAEVNLRVIAKGDTVIVRLVNPDESLFAEAPMPQNHNQGLIKCIDSSRGYGLRLKSPDGRFMWVGISFQSRNDSFDFNAAIEDFEEKRENEKNVDKISKQNEPKKDFSLKSGEKISFKVGDSESGNNKPKSSGNQSGGFGLAPPPGSKTTGGLPGPKSSISGNQSDWSNTSTKGSNSNNSSGFDLLDGGFGSNNSSGENNNKQQQKNSDPFADFGNWGSSNNTSNNTSNNNKQSSGNSDPWGDFGNFGGNSSNNNKNNNNNNDFFSFGNNNNNNQNQGNNNNNWGNFGGNQQQQQQKSNNNNNNNINLLDM